MAKEIQILHEGHKQWEALQIKNKWWTLEIHQCHGGDVEISCEDREGAITFLLSQDELKQVITFLQSKVQ